MKINKMEGSYTGIGARDCELIYIFDYKGFNLTYHKDSDDTYWSLKFNSIIAYKVTSEEFSGILYLSELPQQGSFFELVNSPWIHEYEIAREEVLSKFKHYVLQFYDETVEIIAKEIVINQLNKAPHFDLET